MATPVGSIIYSISVNGTPVKDYPLDVQLRQEWGSHDLFIIRIEIPRTYTGVQTDSYWPDNAPVQIVWGRKPDNVSTWYGYVNHHSITSNASSGTKAMQITYTLIGTSKPMNTDRNRTWGQVTGTYIAKNIFGSYGLRSILTSTDWVLPYEVQANESDFCFINRIADKLGFRTWISGSTGYFIDPSTVLRVTSSQGVPTFYMNKSFTQVDTIRQFETNQGSNLPGAVIANRDMYGVDQQSGNVFRAQASSPTQTPTITQTYTDWAVSDVHTAQNLVQAKQQRSQFWMSACAELFGNINVYPGKTVFLSGAQLPSANQGYWLVGSACHILKASGTSVGTYDKYVTQVTLIRNNSILVPDLSTTAISIPEYMPCRLVNNQWVSQQATIYYDGNQSL